MNVKTFPYYFDISNSNRDALPDFEFAYLLPALSEESNRVPTILNGGSYKRDPVPNHRRFLALLARLELEN